ncbi:MAG: hypothetical protein K9L02_02020 [Acholeplasmataceae bacterium]|nr:hypothetical protein [Acholeplasmataceae bacterium]
MFKNLKGGTPWWVKGDLNGFFGLFSNVLTNFLAATGLLIIIGMPNDIVFGNIVPGTAVAVGLGGIILALQAKMYSIKHNKENVTAMPYGLSVPHYFVVAFGVIGVVFVTTGDWQIAWAAGIAWNMIQGLIMGIGAFVGIYIKKYIPRAAMLGALAGLAITYIAMNPAGQVFTTPYIGLTSLAIIFVGWFALKKMPFGIPAGAFAIMVGTILAWLTGYMDPVAVGDSFSNVGLSLPHLAFNMLGKGFAQILPFLPAAIPLAIYDFLESLDNLESAAVSGEEFNVPKSMMVPAGLTLLGSVLGSPFPTIIYIGHPGWKSTGARIGYSWVTGVAILLLAFLGVMNLILSVIPLVALLPILMFIGMVIVTQAFATTEKRHMPAVALSFIPLIAGFVTLQIKNAINATGGTLDYGALSNTGIPLLGWERLAAGDILVGMLIASIVIFIIDRKYLTSAIYALITAALAFFGLIHAPSIGFATGWEVALGYVSMAVVLVLMNFYRSHENVHPSEES